MHLFAIGDLHLPGSQEKPMDIFGDQWRDHAERIAASWKAQVAEDDVVLVPGDLSWAMTLEEAAPDLAYLGRLPGSIVLIRGNHDYWWGAIGKVRKALPPNVTAIQNDHAHIKGITVCGTRGWTLLGSAHFTEHDEKMYAREVLRLESSLESAVRAGLQPDVVMLHYPPATVRREPTGFTDLLQRYRVRTCVYGHLHGRDQQDALSGNWDGVTYHLVACDAIGFRPVLLEF